MPASIETISVNKIESRNIIEASPIIIDTPYPYIALGDLQEIITHISLSLNSSTANQFQEQLFNILKTMAPEPATFYAFLSSQINQDITISLQKAIIQTPNTALVILDRYIKAPIKAKNVFQLEVSRNANGGLIARPGFNTPPSIQIDNLSSWINQIQPDQVIMVDDVLAFADTSVPLVQMIQQKLPQTKIRFISGIASSQGAWSGIETLKIKTGIQAESVIVAKASPETNWTTGLAIPTSRDFTVFGGKIVTGLLPDIPFSLPYFLPFSIPQASFLLDKDILPVSIQLLKFNLDFVTSLNQSLKRQLTLNDLHSLGFGIPLVSLESLQDVSRPLDINTNLLDYLLYCQCLLKTNTQSIIKEIIKSRRPS